MQIAAPGHHPVCLLLPILSCASSHARIRQLSMDGLWYHSLPQLQCLSLSLCVPLQGIYAECASVLYNEIDYIKEGRNADKFRWGLRANFPQPTFLHCFLALCGHLSSQQAGQYRNA
eukprot:GHUV01052644.1.p1 GENE.GHUV01052644.1~~GHUV01052644.1.p1  ORF type:complete len:117 (-),score=18.86 GHUV01052644.1:439-789(-)